MNTAPAVRTAGSSRRAGDTFLLHPAHRPDAGLALTRAIADRRDRYFAGLE
jgi:hypothetical protein